MENLGKKVGFLKGLMEGMSFDTDSANGKLMAGIVDLLGDLSDRVEAIDELLEDLNDYVESIDEDLTELESVREEDLEDFFGDEDRVADDRLPVMMCSVQVRRKEIENRLFLAHAFLIHQQAVRVLDPRSLDYLHIVAGNKAPGQFAYIGVSLQDG